MRDQREQTTTLTIYNPRWRDWNESCELRQAANRGEYHRMLEILDVRMIRALQIPAELLTFGGGSYSGVMRYPRG